MEPPQTIPGMSPLADNGAGVKPSNTSSNTGNGNINKNISASATVTPVADPPSPAFTLEEEEMGSNKGTPKGNTEP